MNYETQLGGRDTTPVITGKKIKKGDVSWRREENHQP